MQKPFRPLYSLNLSIPFLSVHHLTTSLPIQVKLPGVSLQPTVARTLNALDPVLFYCQAPPCQGMVNFRNQGNKLCSQTCAVTASELNKGDRSLSCTHIGSSLS